ncbi:MAG: 4-hydroxy-tetrahydrodipicolinate reductase [Candidatus Hydrogenedens sp.]|nr:4-hydroxy-tetrahydrodipicolinate reductase [Candidatus Hydrogenedens sp.]
MKICMAGACGRMGRRILEMTAAAPDAEAVSAFDSPANAGIRIDFGAESRQPQTLTVTDNLESALADADAVIDFTHASVCVAHARTAASLGKAVVIGTTGLTPVQQEELAAIAEAVPVVYAPNMSVAVNLLFKLTSETAKRLGLEYNCEIMEIHHNLKKDSPSGTAVRLAENAAAELGLDYEKDVIHGREGMIGERPQREIGMHALRGGDVVGEHTVFFIGPGDRIELSHKSNTRDHYARGALTAVRYALKSPAGLYDMQDVLGLR